MRLYIKIFTKDQENGSNETIIVERFISTDKIDISLNILDQENIYQKDIFAFGRLNLFLSPEDERNSDVINFIVENNCLSEKEISTLYRFFLDNKNIAIYFERRQNNPELILSGIYQ